MKKKIVLVCAATLSAYALAACNSGSVSSDFMNQLEEHAQLNTSYIKTEQSTTQVNMQSSIDGSEKETIVKVLSGANIMNKPSDDGTVVGSVKKNEKVLIIGEKSVGDWYKVAYNGRVCYVKGANVDVSMFVAANGNGGNGQTTSTQPSIPMVIPGVNEQSTTPSESVTSTSGENTSSSEENTSTSEGTTSSSDEPTSSADEPTSSSEGATNPSDEPTSSTNEPTSSTDEPTSPSDEPTSPSDEPTSSSVESTSSMEEPVSSSEENTTPVEESISSSEEKDSSTETVDSQDETTTNKPWWGDSWPWTNQ